jgi:hypothetical protein
MWVVTKAYNTHVQLAALGHAKHSPTFSEIHEICGSVVIEEELDGMEWIGLSHDRDKWRDLVKAVMNLRV